MAEESVAVPAVPTLLYIVGPPAVGKMTVGQEIAGRTGLRLFHNHMAIEPVLRFFDFGSPPFRRLVGEFRRNLIEEVAASDLPGLIFTFVWAFDDPDDQRTLEEYAQPFHQRGGRVIYLELEADQEARLQRNEGASRLEEKPSKRDVERSRRLLLELDGQLRLSSGGAFDHRADFLRINNTHASPGAVAEQAIDYFGLQPQRPVGSDPGSAGTGGPIEVTGTKVIN
ncbi:AAA family ATPase [Streptomyces sp. Ru72]|uniref:AAA family ATPase n=1 Tax=Streptomyces sp. Ru72 TaxID=2080747 RepID=UPI0015E2ED5D|nr:AAA family ATPase [Streptomyces sp. Ru72]